MEFERFMVLAYPQRRASSSQPRRRGRKPRYHSAELVELIFKCWLGRERMCAKRLVVQLEPWLREYEANNGAVAADLRSKFLSISAATIDRVLREKRDAWYAGKGGNQANEAA